MISKRSIIISAVLAIALFIVGFLAWGKIFIAILPELQGAHYQVLDINHEFKSCLLFGFTLAMIPVGAVWLWKIGPILSKRRRTLSILMMVAGMIISVFLRRELIKFVAVPIDERIRLDIPLEQVKFDFYAFVGLVIANLVAYFLLREKKIST